MYQPIDPSAPLLYQAPMMPAQQHPHPPYPAATYSVTTYQVPSMPSMYQQPAQFPAQYIIHQQQPPTMCQYQPHVMVQYQPPFMRQYQQPFTNSPQTAATSDPTAATYMQQPATSATPPKRQSNKMKIKCTICHKIGHRATECRNARNRLEPRNRQRAPLIIRPPRRAGRRNRGFRNPVYEPEIKKGEVRKQ